MPLSSTEIQQRYLQRRRAKAKLYLGGICISCSITEGLEFDHIDPLTKAFDISAGIARHYKWEILLSELNKCQLLCKSCHLKKTIKDNGWNDDRHQISCPVCNLVFIRSNREINGKLTFCSRSCSAKYYHSLRL